jgi:hypothetical protein
MARPSKKQLLKILIPSSEYDSSKQLHQKTSSFICSSAAYTAYYVIFGGILKAHLM